MNISTFRNTLKDRFVIFQVCGKTLVRCLHVHWKNRKLLYYISSRYLHRAPETLEDNTHSQSLLTLLTPDKRYRSVHCHTTRVQSSLIPETVRLLNSPSTLNSIFWKCTLHWIGWNCFFFFFASRLLLLCQKILQTLSEVNNRLQQSALYTSHEYSGQRHKKWHFQKASYFGRYPLNLSKPAAEASF